MIGNFVKLTFLMNLFIYTSIFISQFQLDDLTVDISKQLNQDLELTNLLLKLQNAYFLTHRQKTRISQTIPLLGEVFLSPLNEDQALASRDSITMAVYSHLFDWIIR